MIEKLTQVSIGFLPSTENQRTFGFSTAKGFAEDGQPVDILRIKGEVREVKMHLQIGAFEVEINVIQIEGKLVIAADGISSHNVVPPNIVFSEEEGGLKVESVPVDEGIEHHSYFARAM